MLFVSGLASDRDDPTIVRSTINLVHELGGLVFAQGIRETLARDWLRRYGRNIGQAEVISRPLDVPGSERWLQTRT